MIGLAITFAVLGAFVGILIGMSGRRTVYMPVPTYSAPLPVRVVRERKPRDPESYERPKIVPDDYATRWKAKSYLEAYEVEAAQRARDLASGPSSFDEFDNHEEIVGGDNVVNLR